MVACVSRLFFAAAALLLFAFSLGLVAVATWQLVAAAFTPSELLNQILRSVGLVTISLAVFEVAKFLVEEELIQGREHGSIREARVSLTKFFSIVIIVVALEAVVMIFQVKIDDIDQLIHPTALMAVVVFALIGLGLFRKLTDDSAGQQAAEEEAGEEQP
jgi:hypothetical protein